MLDSLVRKHEKLGKKAKPLTPIFKLFDLNKTGRVSFADFKRALTKAEIKPTLVSDTKLRKLFNALDLDGTGNMQYEVLIEGVEGHKKFSEIRRVGSINITGMLTSATPITQQP